MMQQVTFCPHRDFEQVNFSKKLYFSIVGQSVRDVTVTTYLQMTQIGLFQPSLTKLL